MAPSPYNILPVSTNILAQLACSDCLNYLSVGPVKLLNRKIICGRCLVKEEYEDDDMQNSLYNTIVQCYVFKCINHFDGCREFLAPEQIVDHEEDCSFKNTHTCTFCNFQGNGCQFIQHIKNSHAKYFAKRGKFLINLDDQANVPSGLIFHTENYIFEVRTKLCSNHIEVWCRPISNSFNSHRFKYYKVRIASKNRKIEYVSDPLQFDSVSGEEIDRETFKVPLETILEVFNSSVLFYEVVIETRYEADQENFCSFTWHLRNKILDWEEEIKQRSDQNFAKELTLGFSAQKVQDRENDVVAREENVLAREKHLTERENVLKEKSAFTDQFKALKQLLKYIFLHTFKCTNCDKDVVQNRFHIYLCPLRHISCKNCIGDHLKSYCLICKKDVEWTSTQRLFEDLEFLCDWPVCEVKTTYWNYFAHKQTCEFRQFECPLDECEFIGTKAELNDHWHDESIPLKLGRQFDFTLTSDSSIRKYWIIDDVNEMVCITARWIDQDKNHLNLVVNEDCVIFPYNYRLSLMFFSDDVYDGCIELVQSGNSKTYSGTHPACADTFRLIAGYN